MLSHFHRDHYDGLLKTSYRYAKRPPVLDIKEVYYPGLPRFAGRKDFIYALFAMTLRTFGSETGIMEYDFLKAIERINRNKNFYQQKVFQKDIIKVGSSHFKVLWPPRTLKEGETKSKISKALKDFKKALKEDKELEELYKRVRHERLFDKINRRERSRHEPDRTDRAGVERQTGHRLPKATEDANDSLREAANDLSLAFFEDNRLLFLGDLEKDQIKSVVENLERMGRTEFQFLIAPHHGTHWDDSLSRISAFWTLVSSGSNLACKFRQEFKDISEFVLSTYFSGDISLPL